MGTQITAKVRIDFDEPSKTQVIIRKVLIDEDAERRCLGKYGLSKQGDWIFIPEGQRYPDECLLPVEIGKIEYADF